MNLSAHVQAGLICPACKANLQTRGDELTCTNSACAVTYPVLSGIPILIAPSLSTFDASDCTKAESPGGSPAASWRETIQKMVPRISLNVAARENYRKFHDRLLQWSNRPLVLVIGGAHLGEGMEELVRDQRTEFVETDIVATGRTRIVSDAHVLPFASGLFDGVIIQAVLEYLLEPARSVAEIHRVLKPGGFVYSEMPFMQQVHGGMYDFTRLTHLGHRVLYRQFSHIDSGACGGPGMALAWSLQYFLLSFASGQASRNAVKVLTRCCFFWLKYFDRYLAAKGGGLDAAAGTYFLGRKSEQELSNRELIQFYRGAVPADFRRFERNAHA